MKKKEKRMKHIRKLTSWLLTIALIFALLPVVAIRARADDPTWGGTGTSGDPYRIGKKADLEKFRNIVNGENGEAQNTAVCAVLTSDIVLNGSESDRWSPIGNSEKYTGTFDGQGYIIKGLYVNGGDYCGLFGKIGTVGMVKNVSVRGTVTGSGHYVGGVVGENTGTVTNCYNTGSVTGNYSVGGVVGENTGTVKNCYNTGSVKRGGDDVGEDVGGVVGFNTGTVRNCYNTGSVTGKNSVGGVAGKNHGNSTVTDCYNTGSVTGNNSVGGIVGANHGNSTVTNCYNTREVCGSSRPVGGIVGVNGGVNGDYSTVTNCYNTGDVPGDNGFGGVVGSNGENSTVTNCYYLTGKAGCGIGEGNGTGNDIAKPVLNLAIVLTWSELYSALQINNSVVVLGANVTYGTGGGTNQSTKLEVPSGVTVTLDLCGHTITGNGNTQGRTEVLLVKGTLTLTDSGMTTRYGSWNEDWSTYTLSTSDSGEHDVFRTGGVITGGSSGAGGGVQVETGGSFIMKGGAIAGNRGASGSSSGGGLYIGIDGAATLDGGMICGNYAQMGGGVCVFGGSFELKSGTIGRNIAERGGGVHVMGAVANDTLKYGEFTMNGGSIAGNKATSSTYGGGGVCISHFDLSPGGTFTMNTGTIAYNEATAGNGGGVLVTQNESMRVKNSTFTMTGGTITGNSASSDSSDGGGVYVNTGCEFQLSAGAEIKTNMAGSDGGGVYVNTGGNFQPADGAEITGNTAGGEGDNVYYDKVKETTPAAAFNATGVDTGTLSGLTSGMKYSLDGGSTWTDIANNADISLTGLSACTIQVVKKGNGTTTIDSDAKNIKVTKSETPTEPVAVKCTSQENNDGKITGVTAEMEYRKSDETVWTGGTGNDITGLVPGIYYVRIKPNSTVLASENQTLTISGYTAPPTPTPPSPAKPTADVKTPPTSNTITYDGQPHALITAGEATGGEMLYALGESNSSMPTSGWSTSIPTASDAGTYYVWYKTKADKSHKDSSPKCVTVTIGKGSSTITTPPKVKTLISSVEPQELVTAGEVAGGEMQYAIGTDPTTAPKTGWSTEIPKVTDAGTYYIWYKVVGDNDHEDTEPSYAGATTIIENHSDNVLAIDEEKGIATVRDAVSGGTTEVPLYVITEGLTYRMYNPNSGEHFYTKNPDEVEPLVQLGWIHESGSDFTVVSALEEDATPVYRLYNPNCGGMHFYTTDAEEAKYLKSIGWNYEGISHYVYKATSTKGTQQHRLYNPNSPSAEHLWTSDEAEVNMLIEAGWIYEGVCWRVA